MATLMAATTSTNISEVVEANTTMSALATGRLRKLPGKPDIVVETFLFNISCSLG